MKFQKIVISVLFGTALSACGGAGKSAQYLAQQSVENIGCKVSQSEMWTALHHIAEEAGAYPSASELRDALLAAGENKNLHGEAFSAYVDAFVANYSVTIDGIKEKLAPSDLAGWKKALSEMEIGVRVTEVHGKLQDDIQTSMHKLDLAEQALGKTCGNPDAGPIDAPPPAAYGTVWEQLQKTENPEVYGARKTLATAYQSCDVLKLPAMTTATPSVDGITVLKDRHPAGGLKRVIGSMAKVNASHYYIKNQTLPKSTCFEVRNSPLIYDFGGKPYTSSSNEKVLDFFKNGGSGTEALGIDCSAYVFSALAVAGLKLDPDPKKLLNSSLVSGVGSGAFKEPQTNGLRCLDKITVSKTQSLIAGDIAAINGHVVMIDYVGPDPFGLSTVTSSADCVAAKLPYSKFDFVIAQSSPVKAGIGINRYQARDYFKESATYRDGLTRYAVAACRAKFGLSATVDTTSLSVVRHRKTAECKAPALQEAREECVDSCR